MTAQDHSGYPLPSYAATIWLAASDLCIALPSGPDGKSHVIRIPLAKCSIEKTDGGSTMGTQMGWQALLEILKTRAATQERPIRLGDRAAPVQYDIDAMLRATSTSTAKPSRFDEKNARILDYSDLFSEEPKGTL
jgi:hypothetical protein